jgi:hypothetical protein
MALESFKVSRKDGQLIPREAATSTLGIAVSVLPLTYGQSLSYESFGKPVRDWTPLEKARLLTENLVTLDGEDVGVVSIDDIVDIEAYTISDVLEAILLHSALHRLYRKSEPEQGNEEALVQEENEGESEA